MVRTLDGLEGGQQTGMETRLGQLSVSHPGAGQIIAVDLHPGRLELAAEPGATDLIDARKEDVAEAVKARTGGAGVNGAIETSGNPSVLRAAISSLASMGTCVVVGVPGKGEPGSFNVVDLVARGLRIVGTNQGDANPRTTIPSLIDLHRRGKLPIEKLVKTFPFAAINQAAAESASGDAVKPVLVMADG